MYQDDDDNDYDNDETESQAHRQTPTWIQAECQPPQAIMLQHEQCTRAKVASFASQSRLCNERKATGRALGVGVAYRDVGGISQLCVNQSEWA